MNLNWLHLTDLHLGLDRNGWLWPQVKTKVLDDIRRLSDQVNSWDLVFFTGDFTQRGLAKEFDSLNQMLEELWVVIARGNSAPVLCPIPGNHDLERPPAESAIAKTMAQLWWTDPELRQHFWNKPDSEYRVAVRNFFANYTKWIGSASVPIIPRSEGNIPGDFAATYVKENIKLGIIGLNTTFLQMASGNFEGRLDVHVSQLNELCGAEGVDSWIRGREFNVLLTHQPPSWLNSKALSHFRESIYPPSRFIAQYCGHLHQPHAIDTAEGGSLSRRLRQGPSLFGLTEWGEVDPKTRIHGFNAGQFIIETDSGVEKIWPRKAITGYDGALKIVPDQAYELKDGEFITASFDLNLASENTPASTSHSNASNNVSSKDVGKIAAQLELHLLDGEFDDRVIKAKLSTCPRFSPILGMHHRHVRQEEQSLFEAELRKNRCVWLVADWGVGKDGFLSAAFERFRTQETMPDIFQLQCDDAINIDAMEALFSQQFGIPMAQFCRLLSDLKSCVLIFDGIHPQLANNSEFANLRRLVNAIIDYCPHLYVVLTCRLKPPENTLPTIELAPLDVPDTRTYLTYHPETNAQLCEAETIEKLHERSEGLPMHLDRILNSLKVSSLASVLDADTDISALGTENILDDTPKALMHAVSSLSISDAASRRSLRLLKVLSVLPYGEVIENLRHYLPPEPFFPKNAIQLHDLALLDVRPLIQTSPNTALGRIGSTELTAPKLLRVPRPVRDYVVKTILPDEWEYLVIAGLDNLFGRKWREGKVRFRTIPIEYRDYLSSGVGNEAALIGHLINLGRSKNDPVRIQQGTIIAIQYAKFLYSGERFRDVTLFTAGVLRIIDRSEDPSAWAELTGLHGKGLRITRKEDCRQFLNEALTIGESHLLSSDKASLWLNIALEEQHNGQKAEAIAAAEKVMALEKKGSAFHLQAKIIVAELNLTGEEKVTELNRLEKIARRDGHRSLGDNIAIDLAHESSTIGEEIRNLDRVLANRTSGYNQTRAVISKVEALQRLDQHSQLGPIDFAALNHAYSYAYAQRLSGLFDRSHAVLWRELEAKGDTSRLFRLFRHTSFIWRIRGEESKEAEYIKRLETAKTQEAENPKLRGVIIEVRYFMRRLQAIVSAVVTIKSS